ncbi:hypothetical protein AXG93_3522s1050 [Marchantia polymorpha subsp. ruderalis]|uniref:SCP domain-containing protein n=1 Tax=Marchantia polymorpha subsp. ruderalis TaxID=1480154 RepID=A0A176WET3_MARPO|nr:hypothetical protein AXG93_3522s1050 [Marchantia polymorpha subsp. ruderalis]
MSPRVNPQQTKTSLLTSVGVRSEVLSKPARFITSTACPTVENSAKQAKLNQGIPSLTWDSTLESYATDWAATRTAAGDDCALIHSGGPYGENIFWSTGPSPPADAVQSWVSEEAYYDYASNSCSAPEGESCGHYTQVVWRDTAALGCGSATCPSGALFVVCSYDPAETLTVSCLTRPPLRIAAAVERLRVSSLLKWWTYSNQSTYITCWWPVLCHLTWNVSGISPPPRSRKRRHKQSCREEGLLPPQKLSTSELEVLGRLEGASPLHPGEVGREKTQSRSQHKPLPYIHRTARTSS